MIGDRGIGGANYTMEAGTTKITHVFDYEEGQVTMPIYDMNDYTWGTHVLDDGQYCFANWNSMQLAPECSKYYGIEDCYGVGWKYSIYNIYGELIKTFYDYRYSNTESANGGYEHEYVIDKSGGV